jgi:cold shock CspA family protein
MSDLAEGDEVLFAMEEGDKGLQATWVKAGQV